MRWPMARPSPVPGEYTVRVFWLAFATKTLPKPSIASPSGCLMALLALEAKSGTGHAWPLRRKLSRP